LSCRFALVAVCDGALRVSEPLALSSVCEINFGFRDGLKRCLRGMTHELAITVQ